MFKRLRKLGIFWSWLFWEILSTKIKIIDVLRDTIGSGKEVMARWRRDGINIKTSSLLNLKLNFATAV